MLGQEFADKLSSIGERSLVKRILLLSFILLAAVDCQKPNQGKVEFGSVSGNVIDGRTGALLSGVSITALDSADAATTTAADGTYAISNASAGIHTMQASLSGYDSQDLEVVVTKDQILPNTNYVMLPSSYARGKVVIALTWGAAPLDLDSYLYVPNGAPFYEISYGALGNSTLTADPFASLDLDDTNGTGPETTTIKMAGTGTYYSGTYRFFVHNYSQEIPLTNSQAIVRVYLDGALVSTSYVPTTGTGTYWHVFDLSGSSFTSVNTLSTTKPATPP